jgi:hypothetical protein
LTKQSTLSWHHCTETCRYWDLQIEDVIKSRFADPQFREAHGRGRDYQDATNLFTSPAFEELDTICDGRLGKNKPDHVASTSLWSLGSDAVNLATFTKKKSNVCGLRCEELPPHLCQTKCSFEPFIIIEDDAADQTDCLKRTIDVLLKHSPIPSAGKITPPPVDYAQIARALVQGQLPPRDRPNKQKMTHGYVAVIQTIMICKLRKTLASELTTNLPPCIVFNFEFVFVFKAAILSACGTHTLHACRLP